MKKNSDIITLVAAGAVSVALGVLAPAGSPAAAERRPADATRPNYSYTPRRDERPPQGGAHADYHADYRVGGTDQADRADQRTEDERRDRDTHQDSRWTPGAERYTRPPHRWNR